MDIDKEYEIPLQEAIDTFVTPNLWMQVNPEIVKKTGVSIPLLLSKPGAGKTSILHQQFEKFNWGLLVIHPALKPIEEYGGIPQFQNLEINGESVLGTVWSISEVILELMRLAENHDVIGFLWDDIHLCGPEHLPLMQECFTERSIRGYKLPDNCGIILAGNPSQKAGFRSTSSAIINRCVKLPVYSRFDDWVKNFARSNQIHNSIVSFLGHPNYAKFFHEDELIDDAWASPRQWTRLSNFVIEYEEIFKKPLKPNQLLYYASGHVGKSAASNFLQYYEIFTKFDVEKIFEDTTVFQFPRDLMDQYILIFACMNYISKNYKRVKNDFIEKIINVLDVYLKEDESLGILFLKEISLLTTGKTLINKVIFHYNEKRPDLIKNLLDMRQEVD